MFVKRAKKIGWAVVLLILAAAVVINALNLLPEISVIGIAVLAFVAWLFITGILRVKWLQIFISAALLPYVTLRAGLIPSGEAYDVIDQLTPWPLLIAAVLLGVAFNIIFHKKSFHCDVNFDRSKVAAEEYSEDGEKVSFSNSFGASIKYVNSNGMRIAKIDNSFGESNVYFNNVILSKDGATIDIDNSFGQVNVYLPNTWRVNVKRDSAFGSVKENGISNADMDAPLVNVIADVSFGEIDIFYI